jgi:glutathione S-transferase
MGAYGWVSIVTLMSVVMCFVMTGLVSRARFKSDIPPPAMTGDPALERKMRAHLNTIEWMPIFLPSLWIFAIYCSPGWAAITGSVWILGRVIYFVGYSISAKQRFLGFGIQAIAASVLMFSALGRLAWLAVLRHSTF